MMTKIILIWISFLFCNFTLAEHPGQINFGRITTFPKLFPLNIFNNDDITRTPANRDDIRWTVYMGNCTGSMLSPDYLLTANHCYAKAGNIYTSGACLFFGCSSDIEVLELDENSIAFDYAILKVKWKYDRAKDFQYYPPRIQTTETDIKVGTPLFSVGFPGDKSPGSAWKSMGYLKKYDTNTLSFNLGAINGNSGGAVYDELTKTLVSQTNFGPQNMGEPGWNNRNPEDSKAWNGGGRMDKIYQSSKMLKKIFPNGVNPTSDLN